jgi:hypothetical protein
MEFHRNDHQPAEESRQGRKPAGTPRRVFSEAFRPECLRGEVARSANYFIRNSGTGNRTCEWPPVSSSLRKGKRSILRSGATTANAAFTGSWRAPSRSPLPGLLASLATEHGTCRCTRWSPADAIPEIAGRLRVFFGFSHLHRCCAWVMAHSVRRALACRNGLWVSGNHGSNSGDSPGRR